jgi:hypothetical protein
MMKTLRSLLVAVAVSTAVLTAVPARAQTCNPGIGAAFAAHAAQYTALVNALVPQLPTLNANLAAVVDQATYAVLLTQARALATSITPDGRVVITLPDGTTVIDTSKPDDPLDTMPDIDANSFQHFRNKKVNENHNSRIAIHDAQEWPCGLGLEAKLSTSTGQREIYLAVRLGTHLDSNGTVRASLRQ